MDKEEMKKAFETVKEIKLDILKFVKDFFENMKPVIYVGEEENLEFKEDMELLYELETKKFGKLQICLYESELIENEWKYYVIASDMGDTEIFVEDFDEKIVATGELIFVMETTPPKMLTPINIYKKAKFSPVEDFVYSNCDDVKQE